MPLLTPLECSGGLMARLCGSSEVLGRFRGRGLMLFLHKSSLPPLLMTDRNDLVPSQKLEWVTPKISLMEAGDTDGKFLNTNEPNTKAGPS